MCKLENELFCFLIVPENEPRSPTSKLWCKILQKVAINTGHVMESVDHGVVTIEEKLNHNEKLLHDMGICHSRRGSWDGTYKLRKKLLPWPRNVLKGGIILKVDPLVICY